MLVKHLTIFRVNANVLQDRLIIKMYANLAISLALLVMVLNLKIVPSVRQLTPKMVVYASQLFARFRPILLLLDVSNVLLNANHALAHPKKSA